MFSHHELCGLLLTRLALVGRRRNGLPPATIGGRKVTTAVAPAPAIHLPSALYCLSVHIFVVLVSRRQRVRSMLVHLVRLNRTIIVDYIEPPYGCIYRRLQTDLGCWKPITTRKLDEQVIV